VFKLVVLVSLVVVVMSRENRALSGRIYILCLDGLDSGS